MSNKNKKNITGTPNKSGNQPVKNSTKAPKAKSTDKRGRPPYSVQFPTTKEWTFHDWEKVNTCVPLTLRQFMTKDRAKSGHSLIVKIKDRMAEPIGGTGKGKKAFIFTLRNPVKKDAVVKVDAPIADPIVVKDATSQATLAYEAKKNELMNMAPAPVLPPDEPVQPVTVPVISITTPPVQEATNHPVITEPVQPVTVPA